MVQAPFLRVYSKKHKIAKDLEADIVEALQKHFQLVDNPGGRHTRLKVGYDIHFRLNDRMVCRFYIGPSRQVRHLNDPKDLVVTTLRVFYKRRTVEKILKRNKFVFKEVWKR